VESRRRNAKFPFPLPRLELRLGAALRKAFQKGYGKGDLRADVLAGVVVGIVALPLAMALAIASGVPPQHGLYTAIVGGAVIALLGGSKTQVSGPTAAYVVILVPVAAKFGIGGLCVATVMAGGILIALGMARLGQLLQYVPYSVTTGFTAGIAVVIATLQLKDFLGLHLEDMPEHYVERIEALVLAVPTFHWPDFLVGCFTLALLLLWPRVTKTVPAPLVALGAAALLGAALTALFDGFGIATVGSRFNYVVDGVQHHGIPQQPPLPVLPWRLDGPNGEPLGLSFSLIRALAPSALAIAMLGAIESLLSATVADGMAGTKHDPNAELVAQGIGNVVAPFFGGFAATGAIARTATNIRAGARSPIAAVTHALFVLLAVLLFAPLVSSLPMASLAALLMLVAWNMSEAKHFVHSLRVAPKSDVLVLLTCFTLTVLFDMTISVTFGVLLAALLFMRRMAELSGARLVEGRHAELDIALPPGVLLYEISGPLFFGAAQKAMSVLDQTSSRTSKVVIFDLEDVPAMDGTGLVAFESALTRLRRSQTLVILCGVRAQPAKVLDDAAIAAKQGVLVFAANVRDAVELAQGLVAPVVLPATHSRASDAATPNTGAA
jgi:SulP family sulfate permease